MDWLGAHLTVVINHEPATPESCDIFSKKKFFRHQRHDLREKTQRHKLKKQHSVIREQKGVRYFTGKNWQEKKDWSVKHSRKLGGRKERDAARSKQRGDPLIESRASREAEDASAQPCARGL